MRRTSLLIILLSVIAAILQPGMTLLAQAESATLTEQLAKAKVTRLAKTVTVEMKNFAFVPETVEINVGDTVTWVNRDDAQHTATSDGPSAFSTGLLAKGDSASITFTMPSDMKGFAYYCIPHKSFMTGHVRVLLPGSVPMRMAHGKVDKKADKKVDR
jgi:plastocyanin